MSSMQSAKRWADSHHSTPGRAGEPKLKPVCGELLILPELAIRRTHIWTAPERKTVFGVR